MSSKLPTIEAYMTPSPICISIDRPLSEARAVMMQGDIRHLPVLHGDKLVGIVSDRDIAVIEGLREVDTQRCRVEDAMVPAPFTVGPDAPLREVVHEMERWRYGAAIIVRDGRVAGVFTTVDALHALADFLDAKATRPRVPALRANAHR